MAYEFLRMMAAHKGLFGKRSLILLSAALSIIVVVLATPSILYPKVVRLVESPTGELVAVVAADMTPGNPPWVSFLSAISGISVNVVVQVRELRSGRVLSWHILTVNEDCVADAEYVTIIWESERIVRFTSRRDEVHRIVVAWGGN